MSYEDAELIAIGKLALQFHYELKGEHLQLVEFPCAEAVHKAMQAIQEADASLETLLK